VIQGYFDTISKANNDVKEEQHRAAKDGAQANFKNIQTLRGHTCGVLSVAFRRI
jgi:hypothetical protein